MTPRKSTASDNFADRLAEAVSEALEESAKSDPPPVAPRRVRKPKAPPAAVTTLTVNPGIWANAKAMAGGDPRRLEIVAHNKVIVHAHPRP